MSNFESNSSLVLTLSFFSKRDKEISIQNTNSPILLDSDGKLLIDCTADGICDP